MSEYYKDLKEISKLKRESNRKSSYGFLVSRRIKFDSKNNGAHFILYNKEDIPVIDFWPGTGKWIVRKTNQKGYGVKNVVKKLLSLGEQKNEKEV